MIQLLLYFESVVNLCLTCGLCANQEIIYIRQ